MIDATRILDMLVAAANGAPRRQAAVPAPIRPARYRHPQQPRVRAAPCSSAPAACSAASPAIPGGFGGGMAGGVAAGAITSLLLGSKGGREFAGEALKLGAAAALGGLAYRAYSNYQSRPTGRRRHRRAPPCRRCGRAPLPAATPASEHALLLVRAMIAAALVRRHARCDGARSHYRPPRGRGHQRARSCASSKPRSPARGRRASSPPLRRTPSSAPRSIWRPRSPSTPTPTPSAPTCATSPRRLSLDDKLIAHLEDAVRAAKSGAASAAPKALASG